MPRATHYLERERGIWLIVPHDCEITSLDASRGNLPEEWLAVLFDSGEVWDTILRDFHPAHTATLAFLRDDVKCHCIGNYGPNPDCSTCGGDGTVTTRITVNKQELYNAIYPINCIIHTVPNIPNHIEIKAEWQEFEYQEIKLWRRVK